METVLSSPHFESYFYYSMAQTTTPEPLHFHPPTLPTPSHFPPIDTRYRSPPHESTPSSSEPSPTSSIISMATQAPVLPINYSAFQIDMDLYIQVGPLIHQIGAERNVQNAYMESFIVRALGTTIWIQVTPFIGGLIIATAAAQPGAPPPPQPKSCKILTEKPPQFKEERKEHKWWKKALDLYM